MTARAVALAPSPRRRALRTRGQVAAGLPARCYAASHSAHQAKSGIQKDTRYGAGPTGAADHAGKLRWLSVQDGR